jgi:O-acetyl-ADP-ribose deacetylase (regulator of RNase III)
LEHSPVAPRFARVADASGSISTRAFVHPIRLAAPIAFKAIIQFLETEQHSLDEVRMVLYTREDDKAYTIFAHALEQILSERVSDGSA